MQLRLVKTTEATDGFKRIEDSFKDIDTVGIKFPAYVQVRGSYSNHFNWSEHTHWWVCDKENERLYEQSHGGSSITGAYIRNEKELIKYLSSFENLNYDDGSHHWTEYQFKLEGIGFVKSLTIVDGYEKEDICWGKTITLLNPKDEVAFFEEAKSLKTPLLDELGYSWQDICQDQIDYIRRANV